MSDRKAPFESKDTNVGVIVALILGLFVLIGFTLVSMRLFNRWLEKNAEERNPPRSPMAQVAPLPPEPRLQVNPTLDLLRMRDVENVTLQSTAWIDATSDRVRIPIERAMALVVESGLPARSAPAEKSE